MLLKRLVPYGALLLLCQLVLSCSGDEPRSDQAVADDARTQTAADQDDAIDEQARQIVAFGDSLYAGYGLGPKEGLAARLQAALREKGFAVTVRDAGVSGDTTAAGLARLEYVLDSIDGDIELVLLGLGGNDMLRGISPDETRANLAAILKELQRRDVDVVLTGMVAAPNMGGEYIKKFNAIFPELAKEYDAGLYPFILDGVITNSDLMLPDRIHPNAKGVLKMTDGLLPVVEKELRTEQ